MKQLSETIKNLALQCLSRGEAEAVIAWAKGSFWWQSFPAFITEAGACDTLIWDPFCVLNLSKYLLEILLDYKKAALFLKGCDALAFNRLLQDGRLERQKVLLYGIPCQGLVDPARVRAAGLHKGLLKVDLQGDELVFVRKDGCSRAPAQNFYYAKCLHCRYPTPVVYDRLLGDPLPPRTGERFAGVRKLEKMNIEERFSFWERQFARCIRCFACRNVCPACNCRQCLFDLREPSWLGKASDRSENWFYHIIRAYHVAGRCVDCGECTRVCPVGIPLSELNRKLSKDINELFGEYNAGTDLQQQIPLLTFQTDDPLLYEERGKDS